MTTTEKTVRVLRLLEYVGTPEWIATTFASNGVKGMHRLGSNCYIREAILGWPFPEEVVDDIPPTSEKNT